MADTRIRNEHTELLGKVFMSLESVEECFDLFDDLFTIREIQDLALRVEIAQLLRKKVTYNEVAEKTGASTATIGRVNRALIYGTGGYNRAFDKIEKEKKEEEG